MYWAQHDYELRFPSRRANIFTVNFNSLPFMKSANSSPPNIIQRSLGWVDQDPGAGTQPQQDQLALATPVATSGSRSLLKFGEHPVPSTREICLEQMTQVLRKILFQKDCCKGHPEKWNLQKRSCGNPSPWVPGTSISSGTDQSRLQKGLLCLTLSCRTSPHPHCVAEATLLL